MKFLWKLFVGMHVFFYRLSGGRFGGEMNGFKVLVLNTTGRKSGKAHSNPVGFFERNGGYVVVASNGGQANHPAWYHNIKANPRFTVQIKDQVIPVQGEILAGEQRSATWKWVVENAPAFGGYEKATSREIPLVFLKPV